MTYRDRSGLVVNYIQYRNGKQVDDHEEPSAFCCCASNLLRKYINMLAMNSNHTRRTLRCGYGSFEVRMGWLGVVRWWGDGSMIRMHS